MATISYATTSTDTFNGNAAEDFIVVNHADQIQAGDVFGGGAGTDTLWMTLDMMDPQGNDVDYPANFNFTGVTFDSIEVLSFNYMKMPMPGQAIFTSDQFGAGLSNTLQVWGSWDNNDITVNLVTGDSSFSAAGWTFASNGTLNGTSGGLPMGTATSVWGGYVYGGAGATGMYVNQSVGGTDTIHINGSAGNNTIAGSVKDDIINAGDGTDTVVFAGNWADYAITLSGNTYTLTDALTGSDQVTNAEFFQFANATYSAAELLSGDQTPPAAPTLEGWTDTTEPVVINGANPLWRVSGHAEAGAIIKVYSVTQQADGSVSARTQLSTYTQATVADPNVPGSTNTVAAGVNYVVADANGYWEFQTNLSEHGDRKLQVSATDASGNVSGYSLVAIHGSHHASTISFTDANALNSTVSALDFYHDWTSPATGDTLAFTTATTLVDSDFAKVTDANNLKLTGASTVTLGATALAAGIGTAYEAIEGDPNSTGYGKVVTGNGDTSITDTNTGTTLRVEAAALGGHTLTLAGSANYVVSDYVVLNDTGAMSAAPGADPGASDTFDASATTGTNTFAGGMGNDTIKGGTGADTAVYSGNWSDYTITQTGNTFTITDNRVGASDGTDSVTGVESFQFANATYTAAQLVSGDQTPPAAPTLEGWTDTTEPVVINGANPLWRVSGHAEAGAIIKLYSVTQQADGSVSARTQLSTYTQATVADPNVPGSTNTVAAGVNYVVADANGYWEFQTNLSEHGDRKLQVSATDASGNVSGYSLVAIHGSHHASTISFTDANALNSTVSGLDFYHDWTSPATGDTLAFTTATTLVDSDFAKVMDANNLKLTGASTVTLGATALAAGIGTAYESIEGDPNSTGYGKVITGDGSTSITDSNTGTTLIVDAALMAAGTTLTLAGTAAFNVTGSNAGTTMSSGGGDDTLTGGSGADSLKGGSGANTLNGGGGNDTLYAGDGVEALHGGDNDDQLIVNKQTYINAGDTFDGGNGTDVLWLTKGMMGIDMPGNLDFTGTTLNSIEVLSFNYMKMQMPGSAVFTSDQFGSGLSNTLEVRGSWGDNDITVSLVSGDSNFDASGWTFPTLGGTTTGTTNGMPSGTATSVWGSYWNLNTTGMNQNQSVGGTDTIHIVGSSGANVIAGTIKDDIIDGGDGDDTVVLTGSWSDYTITSDGGPTPVFTVTDKRTASNSGNDKVTNVEHFQFANVTADAGSLLNVAPSDIALVGTHVGDNAAANTVIGALSVTDANAALGDTASFELTDSASGLFGITGGNLVVANAAALTYGSYTVEVKATDGAGATVSKAFTITVDDVSGPTVTLLSGPQQDVNTSRTEATFSWAGSDGAGSGIAHYEYSTDGGGTWTSTLLTSVTLPALPDGLNGFKVRGVDVAGNTGLAESRSWTVTTDVPYMATANVDDLHGSAADDDIIVNKQSFINAGDVFDGGAGIDTLWAAQGMTDYEENFDFSTAQFNNIEQLAFNYMPMPMPGQATFSSAQFGTGGIADNLLIFGAWDQQDITVNLVAGNSNFSAAAWEFANAGSASGTQSAVWGHYTYTGSGIFKGKDVGGTDTIHLNGSAGDNDITGTSVADIIMGGGGTDVLRGGLGNDTYLVDGGDSIIEAAGAGTDTVLSSASIGLANNVENLYLTGSAAINGTGNALANMLMGNGAGNVLRGLAGADVVNGAAGNDVLYGGAAGDRLTGGAGNDKFAYAALLESTVAAADRIVDLSKGDRIDVSLIDANALLGGNQAFVLDALGNTSFATGHIMQTKIGTSTYLDFNTDSDAAAEMRIVLLNHGPLKAGDFIL